MQPFEIWGHIFIKCYKILQQFKVCEWNRFVAIKTRARTGESFRQGISFARFKCIYFYNSIFSFFILVMQAWIWLRSAHGISSGRLVFGVSQKTFEAAQAPLSHDGAWIHCSSNPMQPFRDVVKGSLLALGKSRTQEKWAVSWFREV